MTLIVACRVEDSICIVGDTRITTWDHEKVEILQGAIIKTVMLKPTCALSFAGIERVAGRTILNCMGSWRNLEPDEIIQKVLAAHIESNQIPGNSTDFLLTFLNPTRLVCIKGGLLSEPEIAWIGDEVGYTIFGKAYKGVRTRNEDELGLRITTPNGSGNYSASIQIVSPVTGLPIDMSGNLLSAMQSVIDDVGLPGVGGFPILLASGPQGFHFIEYVHSQTSRMELKPFIELKEFPTGSAQDGNYTMYCATACRNGIYFPLLYFPEASTGLIFGLTESGISRNDGFSALSFEEFLWLVRDKGLLAVSNLPSGEDLKAVSRGFADLEVIDGQIIQRRKLSGENPNVSAIFRKPLLRTRLETVKLEICEAVAVDPWFDVRIRELMSLGKSPMFLHFKTRQRLSLSTVFRRSAIQQKGVLDLRRGESTNVCAYLQFNSTNTDDHLGVESSKGEIAISLLVITGVVTAE